MPSTDAAATRTTPPHLRALRRHFADLRDGTHGSKASRHDKEVLFAQAVDHLDRYARQALSEMNHALLLGTGTVTGSGLLRATDGGLEAAWTLAWPEQRHAQIDPITLKAFYGRTFHHPHLRGGTVGDWPLNVFDDRDAEAELPALRSIAAADMHNLVFRRDFRIVPSMTTGATP